MQVRDEQAWSQQVMALQADETTRAFLAFAEEWAKTTEAIIAQSGPPDSTVTSGEVSRYTSKALEVTEQTMQGFLSIEWVAQMLLLLTDYWVFGEQLYDSLSFIEKRLVEQAAAMKITDLQESARLPTEQ